jgi:hypothetical protein
MNQRWRTGRSSYRIPDEVIQTRHYEIATMATEGEVRAFIAMHHYLRSLPPSRFRFGLYRHEQLVGTAVFTYPVNDRTITNVFDCPAIEGAELGRLVLLDDVPGNGESWFVAECLRRLRRVGLAGVVSFSDPVPRASLTGVTVTPGHIGTVYQALNAAYLGRSSPRTLRLLADGTILSDRTLQKLRSGEPGTRAIRLSLGISDGDLTREALDEILQTSTRPLKHPGNHRYAWALAKAASRALPRSLPYPKWLPLWRLQLENQGEGAA